MPTQRNIRSATSVRTRVARRRFTRWLLSTLGIGLGLLATADNVSAQSPYGRSSLEDWNRVGRVFGYGYSDGYHATTPRPFRYVNDLPPLQAWEAGHRGHVHATPAPSAYEHGAPAWFQPATRGVPTAIDESPAVPYESWQEITPPQMSVPTPVQPQFVPQPAAPQRIDALPSSPGRQIPPVLERTPSLPANPPRMIPSEPLVTPGRTPLPTPFDKLPDAPTQEEIPTPLPEASPSDITPAPPLNDGPLLREPLPNLPPNPPSVTPTPPGNPAPSPPASNPPVEGSLFPGGQDPYLNPTTDPLNAISLDRRVTPYRLQQPKMFPRSANRIVEPPLSRPR